MTKTQEEILMKYQTYLSSHCRFPSLQPVPPAYTNFVSPLLLLALAFGSFLVLSPKAFGVSPAPDGGYASGNTAEGDGALEHLTLPAGGYNTATGLDALFWNSTASHNTADGAFALTSNRTGGDNTATGFQALLKNETGTRNTATGANALLNNSNDTNNPANDNTADGFNALLSNSTGSNNTAIGSGALNTNTQGSYNTASGFEALNAADADDDTATGALALHSNSSGYYNTATGVSSLFSNTMGYYNVASGVSALYFNVTGHDNAAMGFQALLKNKGSNNIGLGSNAGANLTSGGNNIDIGAPGATGEANTIRIGKSGTQQKTFVAGIYGKTVANGIGVIVNSNGQLGTVQSSVRFKQDIKPMEKASEALLKPKPVTFRYKEELDPDKIPQFGLIAEEVEKVCPDLVVRDQDGNITTVRYEAVNAMLLNEFLKERRAVEKLGATVAEQQKEFTATLSQQKGAFEAKIAQQQRQIQTLIAGLQKGSARTVLQTAGKRTAASQ